MQNDNTIKKYILQNELDYINRIYSMTHNRAAAEKTYSSPTRGAGHQGVNENRPNAVKLV